ncbi:MAG: N-acyl-D-glucosamine 2-epimerase, partial [Acidimicrobiales bacterium]
MSDVDKIDFTFSDTIAGYVTSFDDDEDSFAIRASDGRTFTVWLTGNTFAEGVRNFGQDYVDLTGDMRNMLEPGRYLFAYGVFYSESSGHRFEAKHITFPSRQAGDPVYEEPDWWTNQACHIGDFYLRGQFPDGNYDWNNYRTKLTLSGTHTPDYVAPDYRQETDTISRLVFGLASCYLLSGEDRFLQAAEAGVNYLRENLRGTVE